MELKRNYFVDEIYDFLNAKYPILFNISKYDNSFYGVPLVHFRVTNEKHQKIILNSINFDTTSRSFSLLDIGAFLLILETPQTTKFNQNFFYQIYCLYFNNQNNSIYSNYDNRITRQFLLKLSSDPRLKLQKRNYFDEYISQIESQEFREFLEIYINLSFLFKMISVMTIEKFGDIVNFDLDYLILYSILIIEYKSYSVKDFMKKLLQIEKINRNFSIVLIGISFNLDECIIFHKFEESKVFLNEFFEDRIKLLDFDVFDLCLTTIFGQSGRLVKNTCFTLSNDLEMLIKNKYIFEYYAYQNKLDFNLKLLATHSNTNKESELKNIEIIDDLLFSIIIIFRNLNEKIYRNVNEDPEKFDKFENRLSELSLLNNSFLINLRGFEYQSLVLKAKFVSFFENQLNKIFNLINELITKNFVKNTVIFIQYNDQNQRYVILYIESFNNKPLKINLESNVEYFELFYNNFNHIIEINTSIKLNTLKLKTHTSSFEDKELDLIYIKNLAKVSFEEIFLEFHIDSDNGFEIMVNHLNSLFDYLSGIDKFKLGIKLNNEETIYLKISKKYSFCVFENFGSNYDLINYIFSLLYNIIEINQLEINFELGSQFLIDEGSFNLSNFELIRINCFNHYENLYFLRNLFNENPKLKFNCIELLYCPITHTEILNTISDWRIYHLKLVFFLNNPDNIKSALINIIRNVRINRISLVFLVSSEKLYRDIKTSIIKLYDKIKNIRVRFIYRSDSQLNIADYSDYFNIPDFKVLEEFNVNSTDYLDNLKDSKSLKHQFFGLYYIINKIKRFRSLRKIPILQNINNNLINKNVLSGELIQY